MNAVRFVLAGFALSVLLAPATARADFTAVLSASKDNTIIQNQVNNSAGGLAGIYSGTTSANSPRRGLIAFDILQSGLNPNGVPAGSSITSVTLSMYLANQPTGNTQQTIGLRKLSLDWGENIADNTTNSPAVAGMGNGVAAANGDATWNKTFFNTTGNWTVPGAASDYSGTSSSSATINLNTPTDTQVLWASTSALVADVQSWLDSPGSNFGWALINNDESTAQTMKAFYSRQGTLKNGGVAGSPAIDPSMLPILTMNYVPEPTAGMLLLASLPFAFGLRRR